MPVLTSDADQSAHRAILLTTGLGVIFGLFFGIPPALAARAMGLAWLPYSASVVVLGLMGGLVLAYLLVAFLHDGPRSCQLTSGVARPPATQVQRRGESGDSGKRYPCSVGQRLAEEHLVLERLCAERERLHDSRFGSATEQRIIWGELLELELQDIDEQMSRIRGAAGSQPEHREA